MTDAAGDSIEAYILGLQIVKTRCASGAADVEVRGKLEGGGFVVEEVPEERFQADFRGQQLLRREGQAASVGSYHILAARKLPP